MYRSTRSCSVSLLLLVLLAGPFAGAPLATESPPAAIDRTDGIPLEKLFPDAAFSPELPTPSEHLGIAPGERPIRHHEVVSYFETLAEVSPRAVLRRYAHSHEGRALIYLAVGDPETVGSLDAFRGQHAARVALPTPVEGSGGVASVPLADARAVAYMAYAIHGDELSSTDAAMALAYRLVAGEDPLAQRMRDELLVLIDPLENPDGRERYLAQITSFAHAQPNPAADDLSHTGVWPWGRGNHYLFDLNRDWFSLVQPESERSAVIASWHPQLVVDSHEMGPFDTYLFSPARHPFNPHLPPSHAGWQEAFAADQARALDARGYPYYTREWNEEFFPGYGSSWSSYHGAIGILYEMSRTSGTLVRKPGGTLRTYAEAVEHQAVSSMANLTTLLEHRPSILEDYVADRRAAIEAAGNGAPGAWLLVEGERPGRTRRLVEVLRRQGILVLGDGPKAGPVEGLRDARTGAAVESMAPGAGRWLVPLDQPAGRLARTLLDPHVPMEAGFLREEREHLEKGRGSRLYETTAWSLPLSYGVRAYWTAATPSRDGWVDEPIPQADGSLTGDTNGDPYAYVIDNLPDRSAGLLAELLAQGRRVQVAEKPFRLDGRAFGPGTLIVPLEGNDGALAEAVARGAERWKVEVLVTGTAKAEQGPDLGGRHVKELVAPRVGVFTGYPVSPSSYGAIWNLLDRELALRFTALDVGRFRRIDLQRYNVLVFPPAWGGSRGYRSQLSPKQIERLERWIEAGGTAIGLGAGTELLTDPELELTRTRLRRDVLDRFPPAVIGISAEEARRAGRPAAPGLRAPEPGDAEKPDGGAGRTAAAAADVPENASPYDVAPLVGSGARPFLGARELPAEGPLEPVSLSEWLAPVLPPGADKPDSRDLERADRRLRRFGPRGAHLRLELDEDAWLAWGAAEGALPALIRTDRALIATGPVEVVARFPEPGRLQLGGLLWPEAAGRLAHTAYAVREARGRGQLILFVDEPEFRGWTLATRRLLVNALLYGPGLGTRWSVPW